VADNQFACNIFTQLLSDEMVLVVYDELARQDAAAVWRKLVAHFERQSTASRARLRSQLHSITMQHGEKFDYYKSRIQSIAMQLKGMGEAVSEGELVHVLMKGLPKYYAAARDALQMQDALTVDSVSDKLRDVIERKEIERNEEEEHQAHFTGRGFSSGRGGRGRGGANFSRGGRGGYTDARTAAGGSMGYKNSNKQSDREDEQMDEAQHRCALCHARGHWERFCSHRRGDGYSCYRCGLSDHQIRDCKTDLTKIQKTESAKYAAVTEEYVYDDQDASY